MGGEEEEGFRVLRCGASAPPPPPEPRPKLLEENNQQLKLTATMMNVLRETRQMGRKVRSILVNSHSRV